MDQSALLFERARKVLPGGVNSPVRAFQSVGGNPKFIQKANGAYLYDVDGEAYLDYVGSWGPMILGHNKEEILGAVKRVIENGLSFGTATKIEVEMAEKICQIVPSIEMVRMVNSGTEAVMSAIRLARGYTGKNKIIKFAGCYHGHSDSMLVKAGSGIMTAGVPDSAGVPEGCAIDTLTAKYNDFSSVEKLFQENKEEIAAVIIEPVAANMGVVVPEQGFLEKIREICTNQHALLILDEVITGFRLALTGAQGYFGIEADLVTYGKIIGGGMPVGAYGGKREIMECISPIGTVYQAGTLSGNPVAMAAGLEQLNLLQANPELYQRINQNGEFFRKEVEHILERTDKQYQINGMGSLSCLFFTKQKVKDYETAKTSNVKQYGAYFNYMLQQHIYLAPSQFEAMFLSDAHTRKDLEETLDQIECFFSCK